MTAIVCARWYAQKLAVTVIDNITNLLGRGGGATRFVCGYPLAYPRGPQVEMFGAPTHQTL